MTRHIHVFHMWSESKLKNYNDIQIKRESYVEINALSTLTYATRLCNQLEDQFQARFHKYVLDNLHYDNKNIPIKNI